MSISMASTLRPKDAEKMRRYVSKKLEIDGAPGGIRTHDPRFRRPMLLSAELQARESPSGVDGGIRTLDLQGHNLAP